MLITVQMDENDTRFGLLINALRGITDGASGGTKLSPPTKLVEVQASGSASGAGGSANNAAPTLAAAPAPVVATAPVFTEEDVANATRALATAKGIDTATGLLKEFEIEKARDLPEAKREAYIARAKTLQAAK